MPTVTPIDGSQLRVFLGGGETPTEVFTVACLINTSRGIEWDADVVETVIPDCGVNNDNVVFVHRSVRSKSASISGSGIVDVNTIPDMWTWFDSGAQKNIRVSMADGTLNGRWDGAAVLKNFRVTASDNKELATFECSILSTDAWTFTP